MRFNDGKVDPSGRHLFVGTMHSSWRDPAAPTGRLYRFTCGSGHTTRDESGAHHLVWGTRPAPLFAAAAGAVACALAVSRVRHRSGAATATCATFAAAAAAAAMAGACLSPAHAVRFRIPARLTPPLLCRPAETVTATPAADQPRWHAAHTVVPIARVPNGIAWTADQRTMYWIDSAANCVDAFDYDPSSGETSNRRVVVTCPKQGEGTADGLIGGIPDGATIDAGGKLWVALAESGHVVQYDPQTGKQLMAVALPVKRVTACTFGGEDLSELFVTTREETGPGGSPHAGGLFKVHVPGVRGLHGAYEMQG